MKKMYLLTTLIALTLTFGAAPQAKAETLLGDYLADNGIEVGVSMSMDFYNKYVWRGFLLDDGPSVQPGMELTAGGFALGIWGSWDVEQNDALDGDEFDTYISYTFAPMDGVSLSVGNTYYTFPGADTFSSEAFVGVSVDTLLAPAFTAYFDYGDEDQGGADGQYYVLELGHSFPVSEDYGITFDVGGHVGYNNELFINGDGGDVLVSLGLTVPLTDSLTIAPNVGYSIPYGDLEDSADGAQDEEFFGGFSLSASF